MKHNSKRERHEKTQVLTHHKKLHVTSSKINVFPAKRQPRKESEREKSFEALTQKAKTQTQIFATGEKKNILTTAIVLELLTDF